MRNFLVTAWLIFCLSFLTLAQSTSPAQPATDKKKAEIAATVARMARVGSASNPSFSPDGKWVSFISNMSGTPQLWIVSTEGGYPRMVTNGEVFESPCENNRDLLHLSGKGK